MTPLPSIPTSAGLAIQEGASHGAFAWGVLDRLFEQGFYPARISGVSSGALLAVAIAQGWACGGGEGAQLAMRQLWSSIANPVSATPRMSNWLDAWPIGAATRQGWDRAAKMFTAVSGRNPLQPIVQSLLDRVTLQSSAALDVVISATDVETGHSVPFGNRDITTESLLASCCLSMALPAISFGGRGY